MDTSLGFYQIRVAGHLAQCWTDWLGGMTLIHDGDGHTVLYGWLRDQAALHGVLNQIFNLGLPLVSVNVVEPRSISGEVKK